MKVSELSVPLNRDMYFVNLKNNEIHRLFAVSESLSGESILTDCGQLLRVQTKHQRIFHSLDWAILCVKLNTETYDDEFFKLQKTLGIKIDVDNQQHTGDL